MASTEALAPSQTAWRWLLIGLLSVTLYACFYAIEHDTIFANAAVVGIDESHMREIFIKRMEEGSLLRQVALITFGAIGAAALVLCRSKPWNLRWSIVTPLVLMILLSLISALWSEQPMLTAKRLVVLGCALTGCAGLARMLSPGELLFVSLVTLLAFVTTSIVIDLAAGGRPWSGGDYRFGGTLHPNAQANYLGILCLAAVCQPIGFGRKWMLRLVFVAGVGLIVLTQSRTGLLSLVVALAATWMVRLPRGLKNAGIALLIASVAAGFVTYYSVGAGARNSAIGTALLGRTQQAASLTGRVPLWEELADYASKHPYVGYGYEGFWTEKRIAAVMKSQNWALQNAHNSYFEILLQLGYLGLFFACWFLLSGVRALGSASALTREPGYAFALGVVVLGMSNSFLESLFVKLRFSPVIALIGLFMVAFFYPSDPDEELDSSFADAATPPLAHST